MKNECKVTLIEGLKESNKVSLTAGEDIRSLLQQEKKLDRLFSLFKEEMDENINVSNNFPLAYKYVREVQHEFFCLIKYSLRKDHYGILLKRNIVTGRNHMLFHKKYTTEDYEKIKLRFSVCKQAIDYIVFKSCVLKELKNDYFILPSVTRNMLRWNGTKIEFLEMVQFLQETKTISKDDGVLTLKEAVHSISGIFNININDIYSKLGRQRQRKHGHGTMWSQILTIYQQNKK